MRCHAPPPPDLSVPSLHLPCRTQDTKGVGSAEATHSITTLCPDTTVVFSGAATMTTSCPPGDARDPGERADQQAVLPQGPLGVFTCVLPLVPLARQAGQGAARFHLTDGETPRAGTGTFFSWSQERNNRFPTHRPILPATRNPASRTARVMSRLGVNSHVPSSNTYYPHNPAG